MTLEELRALPKEDVIALLEVCRKGMRFQDGFWFMNVEDALGLDRAVDMDADIWTRFGKYEAQLLLKTFKWATKGIPGLVKAIHYAPSWLFFERLVEQVSDTEATFQVSKCLAQASRLKTGRTLFACRKVEEGYLGSFAKAIDENIRVVRNFGPPDSHRDNVWCSWRFYVEAGPANKPLSSVH